MLRKNVVISDAHLKLLDPLLKKHQGNMSATMRDIIDFTGFVTSNLGSLELAKDLLKEKSHAKEQTMQRIYGVTIPLAMFQWLLLERKTTFPPMGYAMQFFAQNSNINLYDVDNLGKMINEELSFLNWPVKVSVCNEEGSVAFQVTGTDPTINRFTAILIAIYLSLSNSTCKISKLIQYPSSIYFQIKEAASMEEALQSIYRNFADNNDMILNPNLELQLTA
ncbi:MAG TPA: hypothetical protein HA257_00370 [Candidatus Methanoperedenaceae archaeon]|nr:hypothetical protein [Candidatus Methanoperedenaceae archaeon]